MAWVRWFELDGTLETIEEINREWKRESGDTEDFFNEESKDWRQWIEYENGKTYILADVSSRKEAEELEARYGKRK